MEFSFTDFSNLKIYYKYKHLTAQQEDFVSSLLKSLNQDLCSIFEFPPTLDKDFLYNSVLFSLSKQQGKKFAIIVKSYDKIFEILKCYSTLSHICQCYDHSSQQLKVIPLIDRKLLCLNDKQLLESTSTDYDMYCTKATASWLPESSKCPYFNVIKN